MTADVVRTFGGPYYGWYQKESDETVRRAILAVHQQQDLTNVDAIVGFSQGATLGLIIASLLERGELNEMLVQDKALSTPALIKPITNSPEMTPNTSAPELACLAQQLPRSSTASTLASNTSSASSFREGSLFSLTRSGSSTNSLLTITNDTQPVVPWNQPHLHRVRFLIAICPIATAWDAQELQVASKVSENKQGDWLPTIPVFFTAGEKDRFKQHSLALAAKVGKSESRHQVETFDFGHEVPRSVDAISKLVRFVKKHSESKLSARKMVR